MTVGRIHHDAGPDLRNSRRATCGRPFMPAARVTTDHAAVTCRGCQRLITQPAPVAFTPSGPYVPAKGQTDLDPTARRAIAYSIEGEPPDQWTDLGAALKAWSRPLAWRDGVRSSSHPDRFKGAGHGGATERIPNAHIFAVTPVQRAIEAACAFGYQRAGGVDGTGAIRLDARDCLRVVRGILGDGREVSISASQISDDLNADPDRRARGERTVTPQQVGRAWAHLRREVGDWLWSRGLLVRKPVERDRPVGGGKTKGDAMRLEGFDCEGWAQVADALGCSETHARDLARAGGADPMPVSRVGSRIRAKKSDLRSWATRQAKPYQRAGAA